MTTLNALYLAEGAPLLKRLHEATGKNQKYLYHVATGRRTPSKEFARELVEADKRLTFMELLFPDEAPVKKAKKKR